MNPGPMEATRAAWWCLAAVTVVASSLGACRTPEGALVEVPDEVSEVEVAEEVLEPDFSGVACDAGTELVAGFSFVPAGRFVMGDVNTPALGMFTPYSPLLAFPAREVELTRAFLVGRTEVTQAQWVSLMGTNPSQFVHCGEDCPVEGVSFFDALRYCNALSEREGLEPCYDLAPCTTDGVAMTCPEDLGFSLDCKGYRLLTDAEWEYAARAGETSILPGGFSMPERQVGFTSWVPFTAEALAAIDEVAWFRDNSIVDAPDCSEGRGEFTDCWWPSPAGSKAANAWGIHDMIGNLREWVWDRDPGNSDNEYDLFADVVDPVGPKPFSSRYRGEHSHRVTRGSSYGDPAESCNFADRDSELPGRPHYWLGFRVARTVSCEPTD